MSAERLREAARVLRERAAAESPWPCAEYIRRSIRHLVRNCEIDCDHITWNEEREAYDEHDCPAPFGAWDRYATPTYIATMHPGVALALADWLEHEAARCLAKVAHGGNERVVWSNQRDAIAVADAILGGAA